jgi:ABC-type uncharacterized transport system substrate-binding protein
VAGGRSTRTLGVKVNGDGMRIRCFAALVVALAIGLVAAPAAVDAQPTGKIHRIGYLGIGSSTSGFHEQFRQGLRELGWVEGQNIVIDYRFADGRPDRLPELAAELVRLKVDIIVAQPTQAAVAARNGTGSIPIVMINVGDPVGIGLVASLARSTGNVTGRLFVVAESLFVLHRTALADLALRYRLPTMHGFREIVAVGGLMSYGGGRWPHVLRAEPG